MKNGTVLKISLSLALLLPIAGPKPAVGEVAEYAVKAAYLYNFTQFVQWPKSALSGDSLVIGIVGEDPFGDTLDSAVQGKSAAGHSLEVKRIGPFSASKASSLSKCQVLFISFSEKAHVKEILAALKGAAVLTVSEIDQFPVKGGILQFDQEGQKIILTLNPAAAKKAGLTISSQLLQVAKLYQTEE